VTTTQAASSDSSEENARSVTHVHTARKRSERSIGAHDAGFRLKHAERFRTEPQPKTALRFIAVDLLPGNAARFQCGRGALTQRSDNLQEPVQLEQLLFRFGFQRTPARERLLRKQHPLRLGISEPENARAAVTRSSRVLGLELLVHHDVATRASQRVRRGKTHYPGADDGDVSHARDSGAMRV
jgi:hypothetical protein